MIDPETPLPIQFTLHERDLILNLMCVDIDTEAKFKLALLNGTNLSISFDAYDLDILLGSIAAVANHTKDKKLKKELDQLFDRLANLLTTEFKPD